MIIIIFILILFTPIASAEDYVRFSGEKYISCLNTGNTNDFLTDPNDYLKLKPGHIYIRDGCVSIPIPAKFRKISGNTVVEMSEEEKDAIAQSERQAKIDAIDRFSIDPAQLAEALCALEEASTLPNYTCDQLRQKIKQFSRL
jgi:hypothetical protein